MGKKKKDPEKRAALQLKKEAKADKAARKRLQKEAKQQGEEENVDELLELYRQADAQVETTVLESLEEFPPPRANSTLTVATDKNGYFYSFGGEYYDGVENIVLDELLRFDPRKMEWKRIITPAPRPPPRCAHSTVYYRNALYVFGGEMATADQYHHYRDLWRFDLESQTWSEIRSSTGTCPTARSGHAAFVWKQYMVVFGGFYEALRDTRWYNDVCVMNLQTHTWLDMPHSKLATRPEPRSACNVGVFGDTALIHGGFCKLKNPTTKAESRVYTDCWMLHLKPILQGRLPTWERMSIRSGSNKSSSAFTPNSRSGTASLAYKNRMLVYGGVIDTEQHHHRVDSVFYNDLFAFDVERRKWFPLRVKPQSNVDGKSRRRRKKADYDQEADDIAQNDEDDEDESSDLEEEEDMDDGAVSGWDIDKLRSNMFAFVDGDGNIVYEKIQEEGEEETKEADISDGYAADTGGVSENIAQEEESEEDEEKDEEKEKDEKEDDILDDIKPRAKAMKKEQEDHMDVSKYTVSSSSVMTVNKETGMPEPVTRDEPLPRINAAMVVNGHTLYVYGGVLEVGDREVTLDDCWTFDLRKRDKWECIWKGTMHKQLWRGAAYDDDDSYVSTGAGEDDDDSDDEESDIELAGRDGNLDSVEREAKAAKKDAKKKKSKRSGLRQEIAELKDKLDLDDSERTPQMGEVMADFYARTTEYWNRQAAEAVQKKSAASGDNEKLSSKELKREGFNMARERYDELRPLLDRLNELDLQQQEAEEERKNRKTDKDKKKKKEKKERRNR